jgi:hypothetical protein
MIARNSKGIPNIRDTTIKKISSKKIEAIIEPVRVELPVFIITPIVSVLFIKNILIPTPQESQQY